jgi:hypothetical protein
MAMIVSATAHTTDGVLGVQTGIVSLLGKLQVGNNAQPIATAKMAIRFFAFILSVIGMLAFTT